MARSGFRQLTQGLLAETFVEAHVMSVCIHVYDMYVSAVIHIASSSSEED